jgi:type IV pilus assembly protein PilN
LEAQDEGQYKRLWFTNFQASGDNLNIQGIAIDNRTVADFMTRLEDSKLYTDVSLRTLKQTKIKDLTLKSFEIACTKVFKKQDEK